MSKQKDVAIITNGDEGLGFIIAKKLSKTFNGIIYITGFLNFSYLTVGISIK